MFKSLVHLVKQYENKSATKQMFLLPQSPSSRLMSKSLLPLVCLSLTTLVALPQIAQATTYTVTPIFSAGQGGANAISENGIVVGVGNDGTANKGFRYNPSTSSITWLTNCTPFGVNDSGQVCGNAGGLSNFPFEGFVYTDTNGIQRIGNGYIEARAINNSGIVTGRYCTQYNASAGVYTAPTWAYRYNIATATTTQLPRSSGLISTGGEGWAINTSNQVSGFEDTQPQMQMEDSPPVDSSDHAAIWAASSPYSYALLPGHINSSSVQDPGISYGINDNGETVGQSGGYAMYWSSTGIRTVVGKLGSDFTLATDINNSGVIVGKVLYNNSYIHGWVATPTTSPVDLTSLVPANIDNDATNGADIVIYEANGVNNDGKIAAKGFYRDGVHTAGIYSLILTPNP